MSRAEFFFVLYLLPCSQALGPRARSTAVRMEQPRTQIFRQGRQKREKLHFLWKMFSKLGGSFGKKNLGGQEERAARKGIAYS